MEDILKLFGIFTVMGGAGALVYGAVMFINVAVKRVDRHMIDAGSLTEELADLRERVAESELLRNRVAELEERVDFAERLLAQRADAPRIPAGGGHE